MRIQDGFIIENGFVTKYGGTDKELVVPSGVKGIVDSAFKNRNDIVSIYIPDGLEYIGREAFRGCENLRNIRLPDSITTITADAVVDTAYWNDETNWDNGILYIDNILICSKDTLGGRVTVKPNTKLIAPQAFWRRNRITEVSMPDTITNIGKSAFMYCSNLKEVVIPEGVSVLEWCVFAGCTNLSTVILSNVTEIRSSVFDNCENLEWIDFPETLVKIESGAFRTCKKLRSINLPKSLTFVSSDAFDECSDITKISIKNPNIIPNFSDKKLVSLKSIYTEANIADIPTSLKKYASYGYIDKFMAGKTEHKYDAEYLAYIKRNRMKLLDAYPNDLFIYQFMMEHKLLDRSDVDTLIATRSKNIVELLEEYASELPQVIPEVKVKKTKPIVNPLELTISQARREWRFKETTNWEWNHSKGKSYMITGYKGESTEVIVPRKIGDVIVSTIGDNAFKDQTNIKKILLHNSITQISNSAFSNTTYSNDASNYTEGVLYIDNHLIKVCDDVCGEYRVKEKTKTIADRAFADCKTLSSVILPDGLVSIGSWAFCGCSMLRSINIPKSVTQLGYYSFGDCENLLQVKIPRSVKTIGAVAFSNCYSLESIEFEKDVPNLADDFVFDYNNMLVIKAPAGGKVEAYAKENGIKFEAI